MSSLNECNYNNVYHMCGNFRGSITSRIFTDFIFAVLGQIKSIIFQLKMFELESFISGFMFNRYRGHLAKSKERYCIALGNR